MKLGLRVALVYVELSYVALSKLLQANRFRSVSSINNHPNTLTAYNILVSKRKISTGCREEC